MSIERLRKRLAADRASFVEPCLPSPAAKPPFGANWIHEMERPGYFSAAIGVRGDDLKRSATDARDTLVTGALQSRCQLPANACMASHKATPS